MDKLKLTLTMLLAGIIGGTVVSIAGGRQQEIELVDVPADATELVPADAGVLVIESERAEASGTITCTIGVISNMPRACYCTDGKTAGWISWATDCHDEVVVDE